MRGAVIMLGLLLSAAGCTSSGGGASSYAPAGGVSVTEHVAYKLTGRASGADITYSVGQGGTEQQQGVAVPLVNKAGLEGLFLTASPGDFLYFSAQNSGEYGWLTCSILVNGRVIATQTSRGGFSIVTCQGTA